MFNKSVSEFFFFSMPFQVFLSLSFDEDLVKSAKREEEQKLKNKKSKKRKNSEASNQLVENDRKKSRQESISKTREEVITFPVFPIKVTVLFFGRDYIVVMPSVG